MICKDCCDRRHGECQGGTWCDCQHGKHLNRAATEPKQTATDTSPEAPHLNGTRAAMEGR